MLHLPHYPEGPLAVESTTGPISLRGLEFVVVGGTIVGGTDPTPFQSVSLKQEEVDTYGEGDINCNGTVDFEDLIRLGGNFGKSRPAASQPVPEPNGASILMLGLLAMLFTRPRYRDDF